jgi:Ca2+-binding RTX toxin-like protein
MVMRRSWIGVAGVSLGCALAVALPAMAETFKGTGGDDRLVGTQGADEIFGKAGNDTIRGRGRIDLLVGGPGEDDLQGGLNFDEIYGGRGDDKIRAREGVRDQIDCGPGRDTAIVDRFEDGLFDCEIIKEAGPE